MKKAYLLSAMGALLLASCANDEVIKTTPVNPNASKEVAMDFNFRVGNISRAYGLYTMYYDFGVTAVKGDDQADLVNAGATVMDNYMVGYWQTANAGVDKIAYMPIDLGQAGNYLNDHYTNWYYKGLGKEEAAGTYVWGAATPTTGYQFGPHQSVKDYQYLKYWDGSKTSTYFYGYAPYDQAPTIVVAADKTTMTFPEVTPANAPVFLYAFQKEANADHIVKPEVPVNMTFKRFLSEIRVAFYETIPGYKVELIDLSPTNNLEGIVFVPAQTDGTTYSTGSYTANGTPVVTIVDGTTPTVTKSITAQSTSDESFSCPIGYFKAAGATSFTTRMGETKSDMIIGPNRGVIPCADGTNTGFTVNVSFKLTADDTEEEIYVYGARVFVPSTDVQWASNTLYTYIFKITNLVPGSTATEPTDPAVDPTDPALFPIIFETVTVESISTEVEPGPGPDHEYNVN